MNDHWTKYFLTEHNIGKSKTSNKLVGLYFIIFGAIFSWSFVLASTNQATTDKRIIFNQSNISDQIEMNEAKNSVLSSKIVLLNHEYVKLLEEKVNNVVSNLSLLLANNDMSGEGVVITINDSQNPFSLTENPNLMVIHNIDLLMIVNELWASDARAISVNDQRITSDTEFKCIGSQVVINDTRISPPFVIKAIGSKEKLQRAVIEGYIKKYKLEKYGISVSVSTDANILIPSASKMLLVSD